MQPLRPVVLTLSSCIFEAEAENLQAENLHANFSQRHNVLSVQYTRIG